MISRGLICKFSLDSTHPIKIAFILQKFLTYIQMPKFELSNLIMCYLFFKKNDMIKTPPPIDPSGGSFLVYCRERGLVFISHYFNEKKCEYKLLKANMYKSSLHARHYARHHILIVSFTSHINFKK